MFLVSPVGFLLLGVSRIMRQSTLYRQRYRRRCRQVGAARQEAVLISCVSNQDRGTVRSRVTVLTSDRLDLIRPDVLRLSRLRYGDAIFRVIAATEADCSNTFLREKGEREIKEIKKRKC